MAQGDPPAPSLARGVVQLTLLPAGVVLPVAPGRSLLEAARDAHIRLPSSCRNGTCRACLCRLRAGQVRYRIDWPGLLAEEKAEGWILPCVALPESDVAIEVAVDLPDGGANAPESRGLDR